MVGSLAREKESLFRDRRSQHAMSAPSLPELRPGSAGTAEIVGSKGLCELGGSAGSMATAGGP